MPVSVIRVIIGVLLALGALVHGLHVTHASRSNLLLRGIDVVLVATALTLLAGMFRRGEAGESAAGWGAMFVIAMLLLALFSI